MNAEEVLAQCQARGIMPTMVVRHPTMGKMLVQTYFTDIAKLEAMMEWKLKAEEVKNMSVSIKVPGKEKTPDVV